MKIYEFYQWFANLPFDDRSQNIGTFADGTFPPPLTIRDVYKRLKELDDITRPYNIERDKLLNKVEWWKINKYDK